MSIGLILIILLVIFLLGGFSGRFGGKLLSLAAEELARSMITEQHLMPKSQ